MRHAWLGILLITLSSPLCATSVRPVNPVAGVKTFKIELSLGGPMDRNFPNGRTLFRGSPSRAERFQERMRESLAKKFAARGIAVDPRAKHTLVVVVWGRPITESECE